MAWRGFIEKRRPYICSDLKEDASDQQGTTGFPCQP